MWPLSVVIHGLRAQEAKALIQVHFHLSTIGFGDEHPHRFIPSCRRRGYEGDANGAR
ncbi:hypothetical protein BIS44_2831 [Mycobacterium tuberculosis variant bovis BCG]|nr:hypothetical protein BIS44_2831 [Mycobacterium tuberculosis variant bovis BCG]KAF3414327.1 hypothetical protein BIT18_1398 [Mycobacterium tuberculosis variant bovis]SIP66655.1 hypothetical protein BN9982_430006 [Mycobacterium tuberculosis]